MVVSDPGGFRVEKIFSKGILQSRAVYCVYPNLQIAMGFCIFPLRRRRSFIVDTQSCAHVWRNSHSWVSVYRFIFPSKSNLFAEPGGLELLSPGRAVLKAGAVSGGRSSGGVPVQCDNSWGSRDSQSGEKAWRPADSAQGDRGGAIHSRLWTE